MSNKLPYWPLPYLSITYLQQFNNCPFSFYLEHFKKIRGEEKAGVTFGKLFQDVLNAKYSGQDTQALIKKLPKDKRGLASLLLKKSYDFNDIISLDEPYQIDLGFDIPFKFTPDLVAKDLIVENKTTTGYYNSTMVHNELQATVYYVGISKLMQFSPSIKYQIFNIKNKTCELIDSPRSDKDIDRLMDWVEQVLKNAEKCYATGMYDIGHHKFCQFPNICPLKVKYPFKWGKSVDSGF